eukprot:scaffold705_cov402-Prasinococcus_capsulatus_cf.AAC.5
MGIYDTVFGCPRGGALRWRGLGRGRPPPSGRANPWKYWNIPYIPGATFAAAAGAGDRYESLAGPWPRASRARSVVTSGCLRGRSG